MRLLKARAMQTRTELRSGDGRIYVARTQVRSGAALDYHSSGVGTWRRTIYDNDADLACRY